MKIERTNVTPNMASAWLKDHNTANRPMRWSHIDWIASSMKDGSWIENGDTIAFSTEGTLIDGQHRLAAVVKSGMTVPMIVVRGIDPASFSTKDIGRRRSAADSLSIEGVKNASATAAAITLIQWYDSGQPSIGHQRGIAPFHVVERMKSYPGIEESVRIGQTVSHLCRVSVASAAHYLFAKIDKTLADQFMESFKTGAGLEVRDPQLVLRARLMKIKVTRMAPRAMEVLGFFIKAWNAYVSGQKIACIPFVFGKDAFPIPKAPKSR